MHLVFFSDFLVCIIIALHSCLTHILFWITILQCSIIIHKVLKCRRESATCLALADVACRVSGAPGLKHTTCQHCLLLLSFVVFSPGYESVVENRPSRKA